MFLTSSRVRRALVPFTERLHLSPPRRCIPRFLQPLSHTFACLQPGQRGRATLHGQGRFCTVASPMVEVGWGGEAGQRSPCRWGAEELPARVQRRASASPPCPPSFGKRSCRAGPPLSRHARPAAQRGRTGLRRQQTWLRAAAPPALQVPPPRCAALRCSVPRRGVRQPLFPRGRDRDRGHRHRHRLRPNPRPGRRRPLPAARPALPAPLPAGCTLGGRGRSRCRRGGCSGGRW